MLVVYDETFGRHLRGVAHPESPDRVLRIAEFLGKSARLNEMLAARDALDPEILRAHSAAYLETGKRETAAAGTHAAYLSTGDTLVDRSSLAVARRAAGGALAAVEASIQHDAPVFALIRPPGHHAEAARGMGFCLFNNALIAARAFLQQHAGPVLIADIDYHHGNGTQAGSGDGVSYLSTHGFPAYPGTGTPADNYARKSDAIVNVPLPVHRFGTEAFVALWEDLLPKMAATIRPTLIIVSAGFDYVSGDPIGDLGVDVRAAADLTRLVNRVASEHARGRAVYLLEGGYDLNALCESVALVCDVSDSRETAASDASTAAIPSQQRAITAHVVEMLQAA